MFHMTEEREEAFGVFDHASLFIGNNCYWRCVGNVLQKQEEENSKKLSIEIRIGYESDNEICLIIENVQKGVIITRQ